MDANEAEREEMFDKLWKMGGELRGLQAILNVYDHPLRVRLTDLRSQRIPLSDA